MDDWRKATEQKAKADKDRLRLVTAERERLDAEIKLLTERVRSWDVILGSTNGQPEREVVLSPVTFSNAEPFPPPLGLRDAMRAVLRDSPGGLRPKEVTQRLAASGFRTEGKGDLSLRVNNELWRMAKNHLLRRTRSGGYALPKEVEAPE